MFFFVIALPGRFGAWCDSVTARLSERVLGPTQIVHANSLEELSLRAMQLDVLRAVAASRQAGGRLRRALTEAGRNFIVAFEDPRLACAELVLTAQCDLPTAVKQVASGAAAVADYRSAPGALMLAAERDWADPIDAARRIAEHFQLPVGGPDIGAIVSDLENGGLSQVDRQAQTWWSGLGEAERAMTEGALAPYLGDGHGIAPASIFWAGDLFFAGDHFEQRASRPMDITGRARCLFHGPYIILPPGTWSVELALQFSREAAEHDFLVEVVTDRQLASTIVRPHSDGRFDAELTFGIDDTSDHPVAIRLSNQRAAFDGLLTLSGARLLQHPA
jgi:hypothetical protein